MNCICGYKHKQDGVVYPQMGEGKEPFKQIQIYMEGTYCDVKDDKRDEHYIYACPKCGTLKIEV